MIYKIKETFLKNGDLARAERMKLYMRNQFQFLGIMAPVRKDLLKEFHRETRGWDIDQISKLVDDLWLLEHREFQYAGMDILDRHLRKFRVSDIIWILKWIQTKSWWDTVDHLAARQVGHLFMQYPILMNDYLHDWLDSRNIWLNRTCLIFQLFYKEKTDFEVIRLSIDKLKHKKDFFIQKAIGWSLRQYSKTEPTVVKNYIRNKELSNLARKEGMKWINQISK